MHHIASNPQFRLIQGDETRTPLVRRWANRHEFRIWSYFGLLALRLAKVKKICICMINDGRRDHGSNFCHNLFTFFARFQVDEQFSCWRLNTTCTNSSMFHCVAHAGLSCQRPSFLSYSYPSLQDTIWKSDYCFDFSQFLNKCCRRHTILPLDLVSETEIYCCLYHMKLSDLSSPPCDSRILQACLQYVLQCMWSTIPMHNALELLPQF